MGLGITIPLSNWHREKRILVLSRYSPLSKFDIQKYNDLITRYINRVNEIRHHFEMVDQLLSREVFLEEMRSDSRKHGVIEFIRKEIDHLGSIHRKGTMQSHSLTLRRLEEFNPGLRFSDLTEKLIEQYGAWLKRMKLAPNTIWKHHKDLKMFINLAGRRGIRIENPYENIRLKKQKGMREWLQPDEVERLKLLHMNQELAPHLQSVLQVFLFCCYTGLRISDVRCLTQENLIGNDLVFMMQKTRKLLRVPLNETAKRFIQSDTGNLFRMPADQVVNRQLKEVWSHADLSHKLSFHSSRHTFAVLFLDSGGKVEVLQRIMGHSKIETTMEYVHLRNEAAKEQILLMD